MTQQEFEEFAPVISNPQNRRRTGGCYESA